MDKKLLLKELNGNLVKNGNIIYFVSHYKVTDYQMVDGNILVRGTSDKNWVYLSVQDESGFEKILPYINDTDKNFAVIETYMKNQIINKNPVDWYLKCKRLTFPMEANKETLKAFMQQIYLKGNGRYNLKKLLPEEAEYIMEHYEYGEYTDLAYIKDCIRRDVSVGAYDESDRLVGWAMIHDDGSIGVLHVLEEHRNQGLGKCLVMNLVYKKLENNELPFMHVEEDNLPSLAMAKSCGFLEKEIVWWVGLV